MANKDNTIRIGSGWFSLILTLIFITLKLAGVIAWSWIWVLSPIWIPWAIIGLITLIVLILAALGFAVAAFLLLFE